MLDALLLTAAMQTLPIARSTDSLIWDKPDASMQTEGVDHFNVCIAPLPCVDVAAATAKVTGAETYRMKLPPLLVGEHAVTVASCTAIECSDVAPYRFTLSIKPTTVTNIRLGSSGGKP
jgi:hypothetical protein